VARIEKAGKRIAAFRPGDRLGDYVVFFVSTDEGNMAMKAAGHVEKLQASACKRSSGDTLWCGTCHDPHTIPAPAQRATWYREKCLGCHRPEDCARGFDCAGCHMPRARVMDGGHGVLTDHSIPRRPMSSLASSSEWRLKPFVGFRGTARELGLAYAEASQASGDRRQRSEAERLLSSVDKDAQVLLHLANIRSASDNSVRAAALWEALLRVDPNSVVALVNLGSVRGAQGRFGEAESLWRAALSRNPGQLEAARNLIALLEHTGRREEATAIRAQLRRFEPGIPSP
jgi:predicted CXXCH cytochrome family protein